MQTRIYFADVELPFHVWVRESRGNAGFRWVLRERTEVRAEPRDEHPVPPADGATDGPQA